MRKSLLAMAALMGAAVLPSQAAVIRIDEDTFANMGLKLQIWAQHLGKTTPGGKDYNDFSINNARIYFSGQVNKFVQFGANLDSAVYNGSTGRGSHGGTRESRVNDAFINLKPMEEFQIMAGLYRLPFSRASLTDSYTYLIPTGYGYTTRTNMFVPFTIGSNIANGYRDAGLTVWGNIADGMLKYQLGIFDGRWDHANANFGVKDNLAFSGRIQFTPTMLGFKGEKGFTLADTYLGKQNVLSIGLGYNAQKWDNGSGYSATAKAWTVDAMWEQKFGDIVPNLQLGYQDRKDMPATAPNKSKDRAYYVQGQLLYDQVIGIGKPALAIRYEKLDDRTSANKDTNRTGVFLNYYIKGQDAKIQLGADVVSLKNKSANEKNYTDWTLALQTQF
ncbi:porin [Hydrogenobacter hydrogenophilus]|uniref:Short chain amide porin n=1 Tax=Hydrogenobacter hydrogenophilus TaxID=35835 RepID=A0A285NW86_9AQUI|nr:porin [Hydrogenobacter hydrogenophilus]SNZ11901.1 short chain amide porin [Hydrogenobacter hydrogenophilus]